MTKLEILQETKDYYAADPSRRGVKIDDGVASCVYKNDQGCMCAVGRCLTGEAFKKVGIIANSAITTLIRLGSVDDLLRPECRGHSVGFWRMLQKFHDYNANWDDKGITTFGQDIYDKLVADYTR